MLSKISRITFLLFLAGTIPFVGWSSAPADESSTKTTVHSNSGNCTSECRQEMRQKLFQQVQATPEQQAKISEIFDASQKNKTPLKEQLHTQEHQLHQLLVSKDATNEQIIKQSHQVGQAREKLMDEHMNTMLQVRSILTPAQRQLMFEHKPMMHHKHMGDSE